MIFKKIYRSVTIMTFILIAVGCSKEPALDASLAVNDESCKPERIEKIKGVDARQAFASKCFNRGQFKSSPKKEW